jgi:hypothetical protein
MVRPLSNAKYESLLQPRKQDAEIVSIDEGITIFLRENSSAEKAAARLRIENRTRQPSIQAELLGKSCRVDSKSYVRFAVLLTGPLGSPGRRSDIRNDRRVSKSDGTIETITFHFDSGESQQQLILDSLVFVIHILRCRAEGTWLVKFIDVGLTAKSTTSAHDDDRRENAPLSRIHQERTVSLSQ